MHLLLFLLVLLLLPALVQLMWKAVAGVTLLALSLVVFAILPPGIAILVVVVMVGLLIRSASVATQSAVDLRASTSARIRQLELRASSALDFNARADAQHEAFRLRCRIDDWEGWP